MAVIRKWQEAFSNDRFGLKQELPICFTDAGMVMLVKLEQYEKQLCPNDVTDEGMLMLVKEQLRKQ